jgi:hypothetical protein
MKAYVGGGWAITHLTDRVVELRKSDWAYRRMTDRDGIVRVRAEPGMDRQQMIQKAIETAHANDAEIALRVAKQLAPSKQALASFMGKQVRITQAFQTPEDPGIIGRKGV